ncbi:MAG: serine/threonine protein kinase, partial [Rhodothermales bacterium]
MSPEHWQRIDRLFDEALDLPPDERMAFLDGACDGDEALREEVEALLTACENATGFLDQPPISLAETALSPFFEMPEDDLAPGQSIGPYRIVEPIGRGGMGAVYLAERDDGHFQKRVALKVVKRGMDTDEIVGRFRYERQILARLEHEGVARLLDGGITQDGRPYFVMECVDGEPLDDYCDRMRLSVPERLALFMDVLGAVRYAHHNLVFHRDLKPSNILVAPPTEEGGRPQVKLLDFGIAKLLDTETSTTIPLTAANTRRLTPDYAAPEQIRGEPPTPATDVYALGVILYELLTGRRPYHFPTRQLSEIEQTICERAPHKPSTAIFHVRLAPPSADDTPPTASALAAQRATLPKKLCRTLAGDLDAIILKALRKEPERRYASAAELLRDLCRYTEGKTVRARPDTFRYRTSRFIRQHKVGVAATALIMLTLVAGIVATTLQAQRATRAYEEMQVQTERAESQRDFLAGAFALVDPEDPTGLLSAMEDTLTKSEFAKALIGGSVARVGELQNPLDQASILNVMGDAYLAFGLFTEAESTFTEALDLKQSQLGERDLDLIASLVGIATAAQNYPDYERADSLYQKALDILS